MQALDLADYIIGNVNGEYQSTMAHIEFYKPADGDVQNLLSESTNTFLPLTHIRLCQCADQREKLLENQKAFGRLRIRSAVGGN